MGVKELSNSGKLRDFHRPLRSNEPIWRESRDPSRVIATLNRYPMRGTRISDLSITDLSDNAYESVSPTWNFSVSLLARS